MRYRKHKEYKILLQNYSQILFPIKAKESAFSSAESHRGQWAEIFGNHHPIIAELGMGKGHFLLTKAVMHPEINFIGIEKQEALLLSTCRWIEENKISNLRLISGDVGFLDEVFTDSELEGLYIHFCDPWPKARHHKRRLTDRSKLALYDRLLKKGSFIQFKTDNRELFSFTLREFKAAEYLVEEINMNVNSSKLFGGEPNIITEYEERFLSKGQKIMGIYGQTLKRSLEKFEKN